MTKDLSTLQNGSDIRGVALALPNGAKVNLTPEDAFCIGSAFVRYLSQKLKKQPSELKIGVGHDSRLTAELLKSAVLQGIMCEGASAVDCSLASTPSMFCSTVFPETYFDGAVMITASHLPKERNGMKLFDKNGGFDKPDIKAVLTLAGGIEPKKCDKKAEKLDLISLYSADLRSKIKAGVAAEDWEHPLSGLHIVVDAGNGAGGFFAEKVLKPLGADVSGSSFLEPDGDFPNHIPNPEDKAAIKSICEATVKSHADLGIIFDTDVDRMSAVLPNGEAINRDAIIAMMAAVLAKDNKGAAIVTDSVTSDRLTAFLENELGMKHHRFKRGYKNVINEAIRLNSIGISCPLAIETSGHGALKENYFLDDGAYMAVKLLIATAHAKREGKAIGELIAKLAPCVEDCERRIPISGENFAETGKAVLSAFEKRAKDAGYTVAPNSFEGIRLCFDDGWALLRMSLHDPLLPLNIEADKMGGCAEIAKRVKALLNGFAQLDLSVLNNL